MSALRSALQDGDEREREGEVSVPGRQGGGRLVLAAEVEEVGRVPGGVAGRRLAGGLAHGEVVLGDGDLLLQLGGGLDEGGHQAGDDVPLDVAVEQPDACRLSACKCSPLRMVCSVDDENQRLTHTWVVGAEAQDNVARWVNDERVATHRRLGKRLILIPALVLIRAGILL